MLQQDLDESIDVNIELDSSHDSDGIDMESDTTYNGDKEHESGDEDDISMLVDEEIMYTSNTYANHGTNNYNMIGRQEKLDKVFNTETKLPASLKVEMELVTIMKKQKMSMNCFHIIIEWAKQSNKRKELTLLITTHVQGIIL